MSLPIDNFEALGRAEERPCLGFLHKAHYTHLCCSGAQQEGTAGHKQPEAADASVRLLRAAQLDADQASAQRRHHPRQRDHCRSDASQDCCCQFAHVKDWVQGQELKDAVLTSRTGMAHLDASPSHSILTMHAKPVSRLVPQLRLPENGICLEAAARILKVVVPPGAAPERTSQQVVCLQACWVSAEA